MRVRLADPSLPTGLLINIFARDRSAFPSALEGAVLCAFQLKVLLRPALRSCCQSSDVLSADDLRLSSSRPPLPGQGRFVLGLRRRPDSAQPGPGGVRSRGRTAACLEGSRDGCSAERTAISCPSDHPAVACHPTASGSSEAPVRAARQRFRRPGGASPQGRFACSGLGWHRSRPAGDMVRGVACLDGPTAG